MSDVPLAKTTLIAAKPLAPQPRPRTLVRAKPIPQTDTLIASCSDTAVRKRAESNLGPILINVNVDVTTKPIMAGAAAWFGLRGSTSAAVCVMQLVAHEAPAWSVSMIVHMLTLITMALVTVQEPTSYKAQHLIVTPPEEEKLEELVDSNTEQPTTLDENQRPESLAFDSRVEQERVDIESSDEPEAAPAAVDLADFGLEHVPKSDLMTMLGAYGGAGLSGRSLVTKSKLLEQEGGNESSEKAVLTSLKWLAAHQMPNGSWNFNHATCPTCLGQCRNTGTMVDAHNAATALALLPFLGGGNTHKTGRYKSTVQGGLSYLISHMRISPQGGALNEPGSGQMYSHGLAAVALCEAYALTHDKELLGPAQLALNFISYAQDPVGGGWRYEPHQAGDTSMVGWQLMALKSGYMANLRIPPLTIRRAYGYLDGVQSNEGSSYGYSKAGTGSEATTAIGLLCRMYLGWKKDNPALERGVKALSNSGPAGANMYYNYYATQVMRHWEGEEWANWNRQMRDQLVHAQAKQGHEEGSWFTGSGDMGAATGGRLYCTAMATMILEVYYRHLPLYRSESVEQDFPE